MQITKYEHACVVVTEDEENLVIDPGIYSYSLPKDIKGVTAIVVTHVHADHIDPEKISKIIQSSPDCQIFSTPEVAEIFSDFPIIAVRAGELKSIGNFNFEFFGEKHEVLPNTDNIGVLVNKRFYYSGDSYTLPNKSVEVLAAPASGPWLRMPEAVKFIENINPKIFFPTHNSLLSEIGENIQYSWFKPAATKTGATLKVLKVGETIDI